jgi:hypothetical protein
MCFLDGLFGQSISLSCPASFTYFSMGSVFPLWSKQGFYDYPQFGTVKNNDGNNNNIASTDKNSAPIISKPPFQIPRISVSPSFSIQSFHSTRSFLSATSGYSDLSTATTSKVLHAIKYYQGTNVVANIGIPGRVNVFYFNKEGGNGNNNGNGNGNNDVKKNVRKCSFHLPLKSGIGLGLLLFKFIYFCLFFYFFFISLFMFEIVYFFVLVCFYLFISSCLELFNYFIFIYFFFFFFFYFFLVIYKVGCVLMEMG